MANLLEMGSEESDTEKTRSRSCSDKFAREAVEGKNEPVQSRGIVL
jgi:hypothetical protein